MLKGALRKLWKNKSFYPEWVCLDCGSEALKHPANADKKIFEYSTWHEGICEVCGQKKTITQPRDFGYPIFPQFEKGNKPKFEI